MIPLDRGGRVRDRAGSRAVERVGWRIRIRVLDRPFEETKRGVVVGCQEELYIGSGWMDGLVVATSRRGNLAVFCRSEELAMREQHAKFFATRDYYDRSLLSSNGKGIARREKVKEKG